MKTRFIALVILLLLPIYNNAFAKKKKGKVDLITLKTDYGTMQIILFDETPKHKANFIKLVNEKFYNGLLFHRIIEDFMIQGGDPKSRNAPNGGLLGDGGNGYKIPAEFSPGLFHQKGALAAARDDNPAKESSGCQFYIVQGRKWDSNTIKSQEARAGRKLTDEQRNVYQTVGGTPHLDGAYTVFGQVIGGLAVIDKIASQVVDDRHRPEKNIAMEISSSKMSRKKIFKKYKYKFP